MLAYCDHCKKTNESTVGLGGVSYTPGCDSCDYGASYLVDVIVKCNECEHFIFEGEINKI